jgi:hypothetical protein
MVYDFTGDCRCDDFVGELPKQLMSECVILLGGVQGAALNGMLKEDHPP